MFFDHAYILVNKANLVHNLFLVYLLISKCFGRLCAHHQERQLCLCDTWYLLFCVDDCLVPVSYQSSTQNNKYHVSLKHSCFPDFGYIVTRNMQRLINILRINKLRINCAPYLALFRRVFESILILVL